MAYDSPAKILYDSDGNEIMVLEVGNSYMLATRDPEQLEILKKINDKLDKLCEFMEEIVEDGMGDHCTLEDM